MTDLSYSKLLAVHSLANTIHLNTDITDEHRVFVRKRSIEIE